MIKVCVRARVRAVSSSAEGRKLKELVVLQHPWNRFKQTV